MKKFVVTGRVPNLPGREGKALIFFFSLRFFFCFFLCFGVELWNWRRKAGRNRREKVQRWRGKENRGGGGGSHYWSPPDFIDPTKFILLLLTLQLRWDVSLPRKLFPNVNTLRGFCYEYLGCYHCFHCYHMNLFSWVFARVSRVFSD